MKMSYAFCISVFKGLLSRTNLKNRNEQVSKWESTEPERGFAWNEGLMPLYKAHRLIILFSQDNKAHFVCNDIV